MQSLIASFIFDLNSIVLRIIAVLLQIFGCFVVVKTLICERQQELSFIAVFSIAFSMMLFLVLHLKSHRQQIILHSLLISLCGSIMLLSQKQSQHLQEFFSHEISILWTLRNSSTLYQNTIKMIQNLVDCCKVHSIVSNF
jgi:hypothetical protein